MTKPAPTQDDVAQEFESHRGYLLSVAYRLTGSWVDAEDAVSDAWLRWQQHRQEVTTPRAWLTTVVSRIALDQLRSARARRETYVGPWLPEPVVTTSAGRAGELVGTGRLAGDPADAAVQAADVRMAFLVVLDTLTPEQRVAVVLHDALGVPFADIAGILGTSVEATRQHASRGRRKLAGADLAPPDPPDVAAAVVRDLMSALQRADTGKVAKLLAPDIVLAGDGGGRVSAARRPLQGAEEVGRLLLGLAAQADDRVRFDFVDVNGAPGLLVHFDSDRRQDPRVAAYAFTVRDGRVRAIHGILNPEKVSHLPGSPYPRPRRRAPASTPRPS